LQVLKLLNSFCKRALGKEGSSGKECDTDLQKSPTIRGLFSRAFLKIELFRKEGSFEIEGFLEKETLWGGNSQ